MSHPLRRRRATLAASAAVLLPLLALPGVASADVTSSAITTPSGDTLPEFTNPDPDMWTMQVAGTTTGGVAGDAVDIYCVGRIVGEPQVVRVASDVALSPNGAFATTATLPGLPCRLHAVPAGPASAPAPDADLTSFAGPRVLFGAFFTVRDNAVPDADGFLAFRIQRRGYANLNGLLSAAVGAGATPAADPDAQTVSGMQEIGYVQGEAMRQILGSAGVLLPASGQDAAAPATAQLEVDGHAAHVVPQLGVEHVRLVEHVLDPVSGDLRVVESAPIGRVVSVDDDGHATVAASGLVLRRTFRQSHDGRVFTFSDEYRSTDGVAHDVEARYLQSGLSASDAGLTYRVPWATGAAYVPPVLDTEYGPSPTTPATIYAHRDDLVVGSRTIPETGGEGAFAYDTPVARTTVLGSNALLVQVRRAVPAGGAASVDQRIVQGTSVAEVDGLLRDTAPTGPVTDPGPGSGSGTGSGSGVGSGSGSGSGAVEQPAPIGPVVVPVTPGLGGATRPGAVPATPSVDPTPLVRSAVLKAFGARGAGARLRGRGPVTATSSAAPAGRYAVVVRRTSPRGPQVATAGATLKAGGKVTLRLRSTADGRRWLASRAVRRKRTVRTFVTVTWTPAGGSPRTAAGRVVLRLR